MLHTRFKAESPVLKVGSCHGTQLKVTGLSALSRKPNLDKLAIHRAPLGVPPLCDLSVSAFSSPSFSSPLLPSRYSSTLPLFQPPTVNGSWPIVQPASSLPTFFNSPNLPSPQLPKAKPSPK